MPGTVIRTCKHHFEMVAPIAINLDFACERAWRIGCACCELDRSRIIAKRYRDLALGHALIEYVRFPTEIDDSGVRSSPACTDCESHQQYS